MIANKGRTTDGDFSKLFAQTLGTNNKKYCRRHNLMESLPTYIEFNTVTLQLMTTV
jgi:hypothetical protein